MKNVKMHFSRDVFYNDPTIPLYSKGHTYDIAENNVEKWLKRGAEIVSEMPKEEAKQAAQRQVEQHDAPPVQEQVVEQIEQVEAATEPEPKKEDKKDKKDKKDNRKS